MKPSLYGQQAARFGYTSAAASCLGRLTSRFGSLLMVLVALTLITLPLDAGTITGRVLNKATGQYLRNAVVAVAGSDQSTISGDGGAYTLRNVPGGSATVTVTYTGLDPIEQIVVVPEEGAVTQDFSLTSGLYDDDTVVLGEFVVAAQREGNAAAIVQQRQAVNVQTTIAADAFGDISEGNIGEFLKFLPGINVDYVDADVRAVRVRGLSPKYANVTIDGHPIATSASSSINTGRQFEFEQVSLATVDIVEINKSPMADQIASGMSGNVNVRSKSAFDQEGRRIKYNFNVNINEFGDGLGETPGWDNTSHHKALPGGSIEFSDTFFDNRLGVVAAYSHSGSYVRQLVLIGSQNFDNDSTNNQTEVPRPANWNFQDGPKPTWRDAGVLNLDFKASENLTFSWNNSYNWYDARFYNRNWVITANAAGLSDVTNDSARSTAAAATNSSSNAQVQGSNLRKSGGTFITTPSVHWESGRVQVDGAVSYSRSFNDYNSGNLGHFSQVTARMPGISWDYGLFGDNKITINQLNTGTSNNTNMLDLANYTQNLVANNELRRSTDQFWTANADITLHYEEWRMPTWFKFGGDYRLNARDIDNHNPSWRINPTASLGPSINMGAFQESIRPELRMNETVRGINGVEGPPPSPDKWALFEVFSNYNTDPYATTANVGSNGTTVTSVSQPFYNTNSNAGANLRNFLQNRFDIEEEINSAYGMATMQLSKKVSATVGARFEDTQTEGSSFDDIGEAQTLAAAPMPAGYPGGIAQWRNNPQYVLARFNGRITRTKSYSDVLPSAQIRYEPSNQMVLRAAFYRSILRPDFGNVVGGVTVNDAATAFTVRNYELEPEYANNFDARVEYYFEPVGVVSFGVFYKDISDMQINVTEQLDPNDLPDSILDTGITPGAGTLTLTQRENIGSASLWGAEFDYSQQLSFLPDPWTGLGVFFNATYIDPGDDDVFALTAEDGIAKRTINTGFSYKKNRFSGRVSANMVGERYRGVTGIVIDPDTGEVSPGTGANAYRKEYLAAKTQVDVNLSYELSRSATIFCNISNLFNEEQFRYNETSDHLTRWGHYGRRYTVGIQGSF